MRIGRRGWCFRRPPPPKPKRWCGSETRTTRSTTTTPQQQQQQQQHNYYMTKKSFTKPQYTSHVPGAPLNTTSYIIKSKGITNHQHTMNNECQPSNFPVFNGYGSMKGLMGLSSSSSSSSLLNNNLHNNKKKKKSEEPGGVGESDSPSKWVRERVESPQPPSKLLAVRIMHRDDQIANLEEESMMMNERMGCMERELDGLKHRVKVLEEEEEVAQNQFMLIRDCCYCGDDDDAVSVA